MFDFTYHKPNSVSASSADAVIYLVLRLLAKSPPSRSRAGRDIAALPPLRRTRPCTRVRILPFHPRCRHRDSTIDIECRQLIFPFRKKSSLFAPIGLLHTGVTRYLLFLRPCVGEGSSDFPLVQEKLEPETAQCKTTNIILCQIKMRKVTPSRTPLDGVTLLCLELLPVDFTLIL